MTTPTAEKYSRAGNPLVVNRLSQAPQLQMIREQTRNQWLTNGDTRTTYREKYRDYLNSVLERPQIRPGTSRRNRPQPPARFLCCALYHVPGYYDPDAADGEASQQAARPQPEESADKRPWVKYKNQGHPADPLKQYAPQTPLENAQDSRYAHNITDDESTRLMTGGQVVGSRYLPERILKRHEQARRAGLTTRGDFLMRPEWGPHFVHHRLNALSGPSSDYVPLEFK